LAPGGAPTGIWATLLAGGQARRFGGGDKCLRLLAGRPLLDHVITRIRPQVAGLLLNANGEAARFAFTGLPVIADDVPGFAGPLAGILASLDWLALHQPAVAWLLSVPTDAPFLPTDLVTRLVGTRAHAGARIACAASDGRRHPVVALWPVDLRFELRHALVQESIHKVDQWAARFPRAVAEFAAAPFDPFFNINAAADLAEAEREIASS
jgi:molybdopterin-guanine dinucleotide biosynthesis protein A